MKLAFAAVALALVSVPAMAQVTHETAVEHKGKTVAVTYEPKVDYDLRQLGMGRPGLASCLWTAKVQVQRTAVGADGQPIAALTRMVEGSKSHTGQRVGHCATLTEKEKASFLGSEASVRAHLQTVAAADTRGLHAELTSLATLGSAASHVR